MADNKSWARDQAGRIRDFYNVYTRGFSAEEFRRLFTRDTRDAYRYFSRGIDREELAQLPWWERPVVFLRGVFLAITMKMSPARRVLFAIALIAGFVGLISMLRGFHTAWIPIDPIVLRFPLPAPIWPGGTGWLLLSIVTLILLVLLEVFERLSLKNDLEIARDIQQAMLPRGLYSSGGLDAFGVTRPANTVGGDFYDILPLPDGRVVVALGDVAGKGSPAALLMALLLAMLRTLLDEGLDAAPLLSRLNVQIVRHAPSSRFITLLFVTVNPATGALVAVNAGHLPGLIRRRNGDIDRLSEGGIALGMFDNSTYTTQTTTLEPGDLLVLYSDGITEAENPSGVPFDEEGLLTLIRAHAANPDLADVGRKILKAVEHHAQDVRFADDLTVLMVRRPEEPAAGSKEGYSTSKQ
ncbi:MAG: PP2C family protein-serine/threonine phosphatase [Acidobacteria bacterium]|nr:PP2C family protein-serine/threonine phosphatase [Acidobacteriota bacterium]